MFYQKKPDHYELEPCLEKITYQSEKLNGEKNLMAHGSSIMENYSTFYNKEIIFLFIFQTLRKL